MTTSRACGELDELEPMRRVVRGEMQGVVWRGKAQPADIDAAARDPTTTATGFVRDARMVATLMKYEQYEQCRDPLARCVLAGRHLSDSDVWGVCADLAHSGAIWLPSVIHFARGLVAANRGTLALRVAAATDDYKVWAAVYPQVAAAAAHIGDEATLRATVLRSAGNASLLNDAAEALRAAVSHGSNPGWTLRVFDVISEFATESNRAYFAELVAKYDAGKTVAGGLHWRALAKHRSEDAVSGAAEMLLRDGANGYVADLIEDAQFSCEQLDHLIARVEADDQDNKDDVVGYLRGVRERLALSDSAVLAAGDVLSMP